MNILTPITGECILTSLYDSEQDRYALRIDRADPHIAIDPDLLNEIGANPNHMAWIDGDGAFLHIKGVNREVTYRIGALRPYGGSYAYGDVYEGLLT